MARLYLLVCIILSYSFQVGLEFDFEREARSMDRIANSFSSYKKEKELPVLIPRPIPNFVTRYVRLSLSLCLIFTILVFSFFQTCVEIQLF